MNCEAPESSPEAVAFGDRLTSKSYGGYIFPAFEVTIPLGVGDSKSESPLKLLVLIAVVPGPLAQLVPGGTGVSREQFELTTPRVSDRCVVTVDEKH